MSCIAFSTYAVTNVVTGQMYIGSTRTCITRRFREHLSAANHVIEGKSPLSAAIRKYGRCAFVVDKLTESRSYSDALHTEKVLILQYNSCCYGGNGYNRRVGPIGGDCGEDHVPLGTQSCICRTVARRVWGGVRQSTPASF
jgi:predicted GIY-YIG superfamily endonuclease